MGCDQRALDSAPITQVMRGVGGAVLRDECPEMGGEVTVLHGSAVGVLG